MAAGPVFALLTMMEEEGEKVDEEEMKRMMNFLASKGVQNVICGGTTGEFCSMQMQERKEMMALVRKEMQSAYVIAHVSACAQQDCIELCRHAEEVGCDAVLLLPPFYYASASAAGIERFLCAVLDSCPLPCYLYNFPRHTGNSITPAMLKTLVGKYPDRIIGIKDSSGSLETATSFKEAAPGLQVYVGNDNIADKVLRSGLSGSVTGACNVLPESLIDISKRYREGGQEDVESSGEDESRELIQSWHQFVSSRDEGEIPCTKAAVVLRMRSRHILVD
ncbi:hypothetical protein GUITHDRAFT_138919 [Guillardia theta CCMP2712]|uniref:Dihydrodipicolinate synthase n=1 Tax=Guillardia theta (strain CCMP2712) TaxID=905079 RepID=L1JB14_GUITC|nr:hypothetical protein GUITHDRAFT_138919 [Guillardia theta CCMP2712]EKX45726.1 hypothetical protein GUITHDRAFT_138919 [Guillardia theta CCMP2712]|eukprot:XP_005832706.1 hypothetical protein GUITHDRAFT_138919 [Guillardia theta CCMP2712]